MIITESRPKRVLIASSHSLFGNGLQHLLEQRWGADVLIVGLVSTTEQAAEALREHEPDLVVVDYDDETLNRDEFLARFMEFKGTLRIVLLSLENDKDGAEAIIYDRRTMQAERIDDWMEMEIPVSNKDRE
ncbi:MAG: hypothetical protein H8E28_07580 [Anaerolineae bacterium]|nr:hypothetical protein [Anaerolineae bacterium]MBL6965753.1 hypothetical protein [Anaerolineales bacterium]